MGNTLRRWRVPFMRRENEKQLLLGEGGMESYVLPYTKRRDLILEESTRYARAQAVPPRLLEVISGLMLGMLIFAFCNVYASAVFMQHPALYPHLQAGVGINVLAAAILCAVSVRYSKLGVYIGSPDINPTIIHVALVNQLARVIPAGQLATQLLPTLLAAITASTTLVAVSTYVLGAYNLTRLVQFTPTTVVRGFLACVGMEIIRTAIENATGVAFHHALAGNVELVLNARFWMWLIPALAVGVPLYTLKRFDVIPTAILFPLFLIAPVVLFYATLMGTGTTLEQARHAGWLYPEARAGDCLDHWRSFDVASINWPALLGSGWYLLMLVIIVSVDFLLKLVGTESTLKRDVDFDHEFKVTGIANAALALLSLPPGYGSLKFMLLNFAVVGNPEVRLPTALAAVFNFGLFAAGFPLINFLPRFFLAGLFIYAALTFMVENLIDSYRLLTKKEFCVVWVVLLLHFFLPLYVEVGVGLLLASGIFVVQYATRSPIKVLMSGADYRAVTRTLPETQKLAQLGDQMLTIVRLQGYIFFGSATQVLEALSPFLTPEGPGPATLHRHIVLDFDEVTGVDSSSNAVFHKLARQTRTGNVTVLFSGLNPRRYMRFKQADVISNAVTFPEMDSAVEWCEDQMLQFSRDQREKWLVSDVLRYIHAVHYIQYMLAATFHGFLSPGLLRRFATYCEAKTFKPGKKLSEPGSMIEELYFLRDGRIEVFLPTGDGGRMKRTGIRTGGTFLHVEGFWLRRRAEGMVTVAELTHVWALSRDGMERMQREAPDIAIALRDSVLRHLIITDMRLRRRLLAFGGQRHSVKGPAHSTLASWSSRVTGLVCSMVVRDEDLVDEEVTENPSRHRVVGEPVRETPMSQGYLPPLLEAEIAQYTDFYNHQVVDAPPAGSYIGNRGEERRKLLHAIHVVHCLQGINLSETNTFQCTNIRPQGAVAITLEQFLECMRHAMLAPLARGTKEKLKEMFTDRAGGRETIEAGHLYQMCRPAGHNVTNEQLRELLADVDEDVGPTVTFDKVLHLFSRLHRRQLFAQQLERAFGRFVNPMYRPEEDDSSPHTTTRAVITVGSLMESLPYFGVYYDEATVRMIVLEADIKMDGGVDFDEFVTAICNL